MASLWEVAIKHNIGRKGFRIEPIRLRCAHVQSGWRDLPISSEHAMATLASLPLHRDPFDCRLIAQAHVEDVTLVTSDEAVARYPGRVQKL